MIDILANNPLLLLFTVSAIGYLIGRINIGGISLGVAAVLFVGLAFGALDQRLRLPDIIYLLGLVIFVYTIGLSSGPGFIASFRRRGLRNNLFVGGVIVVAAGIAVVLRMILGLNSAQTAGLFAGSLTNTPALAAVIEQLSQRGADEVLRTEPVVGYSVAYPVGVLGMILAIYLTRRLWRIDLAQESQQLREFGAVGEHLINCTIRVTNANVDGQSIAELVRANGWNVIFSRRQHDGRIELATGAARLNTGDLISVVGSPEAVAQVTAVLGEPTDEQLMLDRHTLDFRRIFVSNPAVIGVPLRMLNLPSTLGAVITRIRRGDVELLPHGDTVLEPGDRVRVVTQRDNMDRVSAFFGDSYRSLAEIDVVSLGLGTALGMLVGLIPIPLPGGGSFSLGLAGGPLIVALILGWRGRTGPIIWSLPYSANLTLRQVGMTLFLAGIGTRAGYSFFTTITQGNGLFLFIGGALITIPVAILTLFIGYKLLKIPFSLLIGMLAGLQTQPAVLAFANEQAGNEAPNIGYAMVFPTAMVVKIILAQILLG
ncbi:MAG TPA: transporter [Chloroflexus aurantiacus]|uniref:YidE/YbjL duplication n=1 Tax=Chloroflexus aurantiacus (strain ATCC 29366 / DSM 635 / J-10-fl) TaxID=324602 RepID=A9WKC0_CHLAA|nr:aspartate:alanine exchanger family transporter [Chloroflexus aurantiacus]ABY35998.1 YidE/YbjL duplication [Chloroflexus aurantiacus J-10-fl]GIV91480.1 MAG: transporter [Chloroflexus sp.]HBW68812.1 transporter [Chloroflexus aurantiacus]